MIAFLEGTLAGRTDACAYLNVGGVGFEVGMSQASLSELPEIGERALVFTHMQVREDAISLFGFVSQQEKELFEKLITVSGVGAKVALAALSSYSPSQLTGYIAAQDVAAIQRIPGIGKKTASRIILELKGSFEEGATALSDAGSSRETEVLKSVTAAMLSMGFSSAEVEMSLKGAPDGADESALLQFALKRIGA